MKNVTPASDPTTAFLREVDEALQQEKLLAVWHNSKWFILAAVILLILSVAGQQVWVWWQQHQARTMADRWYAFSQLKTDSERLKELPAVLQSTKGGTHALAVYKLAAMQHTPAEKAKAYMQVVNDSSNPQWLRDLSRLNAAIVLLENSPTEARTQLELLAQNNSKQLASPAYAPALELLALLSQQAGDAKSARGYTETLLNLPGLPSDMRQRALQRYGSLGGPNT
jgi:hypothetical protein